MNIEKNTILQAWKSDEYRAGLPEEVRAAIPAKPTIEDGRELSDDELETAAGGTTPIGVAAAALSASDGVAIGGIVSAGFGGGLAAGLSD